MILLEERLRHEQEGTTAVRREADSARQHSAQLKDQVQRLQAKDLHLRQTLSEMSHAVKQQQQALLQLRQGREVATKQLEVGCWGFNEDCVILLRVLFVICFVGAACNGEAQSGDLAGYTAA